MTELNVAVIGLGLGQHFVSAYTQSEAVQRLVICDPDSRRVEQVRAEFPRVTAAYQDIGTMLQAERLDAISVVTPDHLHRPHAEACLRAGCHVMLTKPLATNLEDARAIVRCAEEAGRLLTVAHERRFRSPEMRIAELLAAGVLGEIVHLRVDLIQDKRGQFQRSPWYASAEAGRTAMVGTGIHGVDLARHLIGRPIQSVVAYSNRLGPLAFPTHKTTAALYRFEGNAIGQVTVSYERHGQPGAPADSDFHLVATQGMVVGTRVARDDREGWEDLPRAGRDIATGIRRCVEDFLEAIRAGRQVAVTGRDAFASLAACVAADESAASGRPAVPAPADF
jgi:predicted dehydrogenase